MKEFTLPAYNVAIRGTTQDRVIDPLRESFLGAHQSTEWLVIFENSRRLTVGGTTNAYGVPATRFLTSAVLGILSQPEVTEQLPSEIRERAAVTYYLIEHLAQVTTAKGRDDFTAGYKNSGLLNLGSEQLKQDLRNPETIGRLAGGIFSDSKNLTGGALNIIRRQYPECVVPATVIKRSKGLLAAAKIMHELVPKAFKLLGSPYVYSRYLRGTKDEKGRLRIRFSQEALAYLGDKLLLGDGCPASKMKAFEGKGSLLEHDWEEVVDYLVPPHATIEAYEEPGANDFVFV